MRGVVKKLPVVVCCSILFALAGSRASGQSRPLATEDPEVVGPGQILFEAGVDYSQDMFYPASGLKGNLWRVGTFGFNFGVSSIAEIQLKGGLRDHLAITSRSLAPLSDMLTIPAGELTTGDFPDATIGAKVRFSSETASRPSMAVKFSTRLPNEGNESGLGLDTFDFNFNLAIAKTVQSSRIVGNVGFGILADPVRGDSQNDVLNYGLSVAHAVKTGVELVAEVNGRANTRSGTPPIGTESRSVMRIGGRFTQGPVRLDAAFLAGITDHDPTWGFTAGLTWVFKAFTVQ
jgi:hypothetical protein